MDLLNDKKEVDMFINKNTKEYVCDSGRDIRFHSNSFLLKQEEIQENFLQDELDFCQ